MSTMDPFEQAARDMFWYIDQANYPPLQLVDQWRELITGPDMWQIASDGRFYPREFLLHGHEPEPRR